MKRLLKISLLILLTWTVIALATPSPVTSLESTSNQLLMALKQNRAKIKGNPAYAEVLARRILLPHVDVKAMSRLVLGRNAWLKASAGQKARFMDEFATFMIRTYSTALSSYTNESIQFLPLRSDYKSKHRVLVKSKIIQEGGPSIPVNYRLVLRGNQWKMYDMTVDGISMVKSFRSQFSSEINKNGIDGLLVAMNKHNAKK